MTRSTLAFKQEALRRSVSSLREVHPSGDYGFRHALTPLGGGSKRALDLTLTLLALAVLWPLLLAVAIAIKLDSPGPVIFKQRRGGFRGRMFHVLKFRTMRKMEDGDQIRQAVWGDARITRIGRFLRRTSIDELPQLFNVLLGQMSLVGPRPHARAHDDAFWNIDGRYPARFFARPGLTGLAQVSGARGCSETDDKVRSRIDYDVAYVTNWSIWLDVRIIAKTIRVVFSDPNAV